MRHFFSRREQEPAAVPVAAPQAPSSPARPERFAVRKVGRDDRDLAAALLSLVGGESLLAGDPQLRRSIERRSAEVDLLSRLQVRLLSELRASTDPAERAEIAALVRHTVSGVAAGLRNTG